LLIQLLSIFVHIHLLILKRSISIILFFLVTFAYGYESVAVMINAIKTDNRAMCIDFDCEKDNSSSESESIEKEVKLFIGHDQISVPLKMHDEKVNYACFYLKNLNFFSVNYSKVIYSPPEFI
jgi:hypothetical protein